MKRTIVFASIFLIVVAGAVSSASAQQKYAIQKTIVFKPGDVSMRVLGELRSVREVHEYHFRVKGGQKMKIDLVSNDKNIGFYIMNVPDGYMMTDDIAVRSFDNGLPYTGEYKLIVETETRSRSRYALEITIEPFREHVEPVIPNGK